LLGAFAIGYVQGIQSIVGSVSTLLTEGSGSIPNLAQSIIPSVTTYIQQDVNPSLDTYLAIGIPMAVVGFLLVTLGDRKPKKTVEQMPIQSQPMMGNKQD
jgi:hypothetical protein